MANEPTPAAATSPSAAPVAAPGAVSPVSTTPPAKDILADAGSPEPKAAGDQSIIDDAKADGEKDAAKKPEPALPNVPEKYELKAPEGMTLDEASLSKFTPLARELGLSNEQAQKLVDFEADRLKSMTEEANSASEAAFNKLREDYYQDTVKEYGPKLKEALVYVAKGRDQLADSEVTQLLKATGLSNHKAFVRMFEKAGRALSEDKRVDGPTHVGSGKSDGELIFTTMNQKT